MARRFHAFAQRHRTAISVIIIGGSVLLAMRAAVRGTKFRSHVERSSGDRTGYDPDARSEKSIIRNSSEADIEDMFWNVSQFKWGTTMAQTKRQQKLYDFPMSEQDRQDLETRRAIAQLKRERQSQGEEEGEGGST